MYFFETDNKIPIEKLSHAINNIGNNPLLFLLSPTLISHHQRNRTPPDSPKPAGRDSSNIDENPLSPTAATFLSASLLSQVNESQVVQFEAGTPAKAAEVNQNFQALVDAINANATAIAAIVSGAGTTLEESLGGSTYQFVGLGTGTGATSTNLGDHPLNVVAGLNATLTLTRTVVENDPGPEDDVITRTYTYQESQYIEKSIALPPNCLEERLPPKPLPRAKTSRLPKADPGV